MIRLLFFIGLVCYSGTAVCQQNRNVFFKWTKDNSNYPGYSLIENISQEDNGILWLGGRNGLVRFDGRHFQPFTSQVFDSTTIPGNYIAAQFIDGNCLYGGTFATGFFVMDLTNLTVKRIALLGPTIANKYTVSAIAPQQKDSLWVACSNQQLICINKSNYKPRPGFKLSPLPGNSLDSGNIFTIQQAKHEPSKLWLLTSNHILLANMFTGKYTSYKFSIQPANGPSMILANPTTIIEESDSTALVSFFRSGLVKWNFKKNTYQHYDYPIFNAAVASKAINKIIVKSPNEYFVAGSNSGLFIFNSISNTFRKDDVKSHSLPDVFAEPTREMFKDKDGGIWISMIGGIAYWHPAYQGVEAFGKQTILKNSVASSVEHYNSKIIVTRRDTKFPLAAFDLRKKQWDPVPGNNLQDDYVRRKLPYNSNYIYNTAEGQWASYNPTKQQLETVLLPQQIVAIGKNINGIDESQQYIVCSSIGGVYIFNKETKKLQHHTSSNQPDSLHVKNTMQVKLDKKYQAWFASAFGLSVYNFQTKKFQELSFRTNKEWPGLRVIADLQLGKNGLMYVATQDDGIYVFDTNTKELKAHFNEEHLLTENFINSIVLDSSQNYLWAATLSGVNVIDLQQQQSKRWDKHNSGLNVSDGFFGMTVLNNNEIYCSDSVLYNFKIEHFKKQPIAAFVSGYIADKKYFNGGQVINIDKNINYIELFVSTGFFADPSHTTIQYQLGKNGEWNNADNGRIIIPSLQNGSTTIQLRTLLQGVLYGDAESSIIIKRGLYFYQTWWFKALAMLLLTALVYLIFKTRIQKVRKQEQEKGLLQNKINELEIASLRSQMNPHFIFNTLSSLRYLVLMGDNKKASAFILKLSKLLRGILANSGEATISLADELEALQLYLEIEALRFDNGFSYSIKTEEALDAFDIKIPPMLLQPFVENAIKHGLVNSSLDEKWVAIAVTKVGEYAVKFIITDNGIGRKNASAMHASNKHQSFGTEITNHRIALFNKTSHSSLHCKVYDLSSDEKNAGTVVEILYSYSKAAV